MNRIQELREARGWSQTRLGKELHCTSVTISRYESSQHEINSDTICRLCDIFNCTADYLLCRNSTGGFQLTPEPEGLTAYRYGSTIGIIPQLPTNGKHKKMCPIRAQVLLRILTFSEKLHIITV